MDRNTRHNFTQGPNKYKHVDLDDITGNECTGSGSISFQITPSAASKHRKNNKLFHVHRQGASKGVLVREPNKSSHLERDIAYNINNMAANTRVHFSPKSSPILLVAIVARRSPSCLLATSNTRSHSRIRIRILHCPADFWSEIWLWYNRRPVETTTTGCTEPTRCRIREGSVRVHTWSRRSGVGRRRRSRTTVTI